MDNLKFYALDYLLEWCRNDRLLVAHLSNKNPDTRLKAINTIATNYRIARNFKKIREQERFEGVLSALEEIGNVTAHNVDEKVQELATKFKSIYGKNASPKSPGYVSAASKFLWFRHLRPEEDIESPVVIYDSRAFTCISQSCDTRIAGYEAYRKEWRARFREKRTEIQDACAELVRLKDFLLDGDIANGHLERVIKKRWFHERVFDKFLWWHGGGGFTSGKGKA